MSTRDERPHLDISRQMQGVEKALKELGVPIDKLDEVLAQVDAYQSLHTELRMARKKQFFNDAWNMGRVKGAEKDTQLADMLRQFAEYIAQRTCDILATNPDLSIDEAVDLIPPMESRSPYDA